MNAGIIGFGEGGKASLRGLIANGVKVLAVSDINKENFSFRIYKNIDFYQNSRELINCTDIDLIIIATPDDKHFYDIELALSLGKIVFIEKPLVTTIKELRKIEALVIRYPEKLFYSEKYSFSTVVEASLNKRVDLGDYLYGTTFYTMGFSKKMMGGGKWRTECNYNPCAGGLSHNFMVSLLFSGAKIKKVRALGRVLTYRKNLNKYRGFDFMEGTLEFDNGSVLNWIVDLSTNNNNSLFGHRTVSHFFQFKNGSLAYSPIVGCDILKIDGRSVNINQEPDVHDWKNYDAQLYFKMYADVLNAIKNNKPQKHSIVHGINVAKACIFAFHSAQKNGKWISIE
jgi:predicted dehydrogenase